ncbi:hypothetical protein KI387_035393, partial [Taxus chinensis]
EHAATGKFKMEKEQTLIKRNFDKKAKARTFQVGDLVLAKWDADRAKPGRIHIQNLMPFGVASTWSQNGKGTKKRNAFQLSTLDGEELHWM